MPRGHFLLLPFSPHISSFLSLSLPSPPPSPLSDLDPPVQLQAQPVNCWHAAAPLRRRHQRGRLHPAFAAPRPLITRLTASHPHAPHPHAPFRYTPPCVCPLFSLDNKRRPDTSRRSKEPGARGSPFALLLANSAQRAFPRAIVPQTWSCTGLREAI